MATNREWLYSLDVADLAEWFDSEHVEDAISENLGLSQDSEILSQDSEIDTREKLEADVRDLFWGDNLQRYARQKGYLDGSGIEVDESITTTNHEGHVTATTVMHLLDRQAAITKAEQREWWGGVVAELQAKVDELTAELERETLSACNSCAERIDLQAKVTELQERVDTLTRYIHDIKQIARKV